MGKIEKFIVKNKKFLLLAILGIAVFLRLWQLDKVPVSLFGDELDVGYQAYSILKTGKDYSGNPWPLHFQSLAEWRTPLYLYSSVPTVTLFGISPLGVRLPATIFGILGVWTLYLLVRVVTKDETLSLLSAAVLALSPWHIQYSRGAFELTQLVLFLLLGLYFFFVGLKDGKKLWLSAVFLTLTPWIYSTAKLFTPLLMIFLFLVWRKELFKLSKKYLVYALVALFIVGVPIITSTLFGGGAERFGYLSVFTDPTVQAEVGTARLRDAQMRGEKGIGIQPTILDRAIHNKFTFWGSKIFDNYFQALSFDFLFNEGDLNLRHSIAGVGQFYKVEAIALVLGLIFFFTKFADRKVKALIAFWVLAGVIPSAITRDGGRHASRLILILPPLVFLISFGLVNTARALSKNLRFLFIFGYIALFILGFISYQHFFWVHNPWDSERWWHAGFKESIQTIKSIDKDYDRVIISMVGEPAWIFFAGWYKYPPDKWHSGFPFKKTTLSGFGEISYIDKFYFGAFSSEKGGIYDLPKFIDKKTLYMAVAKEIGANLIREPQRTPPDLKLIKAISYPSGEPAFYLFAKE